ncbi:MAG: 7-cyano-7-deazaguanine synthase, partial [Pirellulaceae bacterium]
VCLSTFGANKNVNVNLEEVPAVFQKSLSPRLKDLLEIASYVYTADCATKRGGKWGDDDSTEPWPRDFHFVVPVRDQNYWCKPEIVVQLSNLLRFLSDDDFTFDFQEHDRDESEQQYIEFGELREWPFCDIDRVSMFSGGLDSLAGAFHRASEAKSLVLVSHRPVATQSKRQRELFDAMRRNITVPMIHVPVWINKDGSMGREHTQRTRSFLYATLGTIVAESINGGGVSFFENGIVSLNFPVADETLRARSSRTTNPLVLHQFSQFFSSVLNRNFVIDNPFVFKTKADIVKLIADQSGGPLIGYSCSCSHQGIFKSKTQLHCGTCSQCIDRRFAILAAGQADHDSETDYVVNVFSGPRPDGYERNMAVNFVRHGIELSRMSPEEMAAKFNRDLSRAIRSFDNKSVAAEKLIEMHQRHGATIARVLAQQLKLHSDELALCSLDDSCLIALVAGQHHRVSPWKTYADRLANILQAGLPKACEKVKPKDETHLQQICDGILAGNVEDLIREFPFMRWGSVSTKPDWSSEGLALWIEAKYVRTKRDLNPISEAIAADITKYGDNERKVAFVIYDPHHVVTDEKAFSKPILKRKTMQVRFIR